MGKWEDATSYFRGEPIPRTPRAWRLRLTPYCSIWIGSDHIYHKGEWVVTCSPWFDAYPLRMSVDKFSAEEAQAAALKMVRRYVTDISESLDAACLDTTEDGAKTA